MKTLVYYNICVSYLGLNSLFGRVATNLLKQSPCIQKLSLYDDDDALQHEDAPNLFIGKDRLSDAVKGVNIVVIGDEPSEATGEEERLKQIGPKIIRYTEAILKSSPNAVIVVATSPLNVMVPLVGHFLEADLHSRLLGATSFDTLRASRLLNGLLAHPQGAAHTHILPVVGGSSLKTRVPLFSHLPHKITVCQDIREKILDKLKMFDMANFREIDAVERAYSTVRFIHSVISGMADDSRIPEIAMSKTKDVPGADYFSLPVLLGKNGMAGSIPLPKLEGTEKRLLLEAGETLQEDSRKARDFINSLAQESVRNSTTNTGGVKISRPKQNETLFEPLDHQKIEHRYPIPNAYTTSRSNNIKLNRAAALLVSKDQHLESEESNLSMIYRPCAKSLEDKDGQQTKKVNLTIPKLRTYQPMQRTTRTNHKFESPEDQSIEKRDSATLPSMKSEKTDNSKMDLQDSVVSNNEETPILATLDSMKRTSRVGEVDSLQPCSVQNEAVDKVVHDESVSKPDVDPSEDELDTNVPHPYNSLEPPENEVECDYRNILQEHVDEHVETFDKIDEMTSKGQLEEEINKENSIKQERRNNVHVIEDLEEDVQSDKYSTKQRARANTNDHQVLKRQDKECSPIRKLMNEASLTSAVHPNVKNVQQKIKPVVKGFTSTGLLITKQRSQNRFSQSTPGLNVKEKDFEVNLSREKTPIITVWDDHKISTGLNLEKTIGDSASQVAAGNDAQWSLNLTDQSKIVETLKRNRRREQAFMNKKHSNENRPVAVSRDNTARLKHGKHKAFKQSVSTDMVKNKKLSAAESSSNKNPNKELRSVFSNDKTRRNLMPAKKTSSVLMTAASKCATRADKILHLPSKWVDSAIPVCKTQNHPSPGESVWTRLERANAKYNNLNPSSTNDLPTGSESPSAGIQVSKDVRHFAVIAGSNANVSRTFSYDRLLMTSTSGSSNSMAAQVNNSNENDTPPKTFSLKNKADHGTVREHSRNSDHSALASREKSLSSQGSQLANDKRVSEVKLKNETENLVDFHSDGLKNDLTSDKTKDYFVRQRNGSAGPPSQEEQMQNEKRHKKKRQVKNMNRKKESRRKSEQIPKKADAQSQNEELKNRMHSRKQTSDSAAAQKTVKSVKVVTPTRHTTNNEKRKAAEGINKGSEHSKDYDWDSKYFTKASEMFFKMFSDSFTANQRNAMKSFDVRIANHGSQTVPEVKPTNSSDTSTSNVQTIKRNSPNASQTEVKGRNLDKIEKNINATKDDVSELPKKDENHQQLKRRNNKSEMKNKLNQLGEIKDKLNQLGEIKDKKSDIILKGEESKNKAERENRVNESFSANGMEKYQNEKFEKIKQEIPLDVDKLFEESSSIPILNFKETKWPSSIGQKGAIRVHNLTNQPSLHGLNATSDKGKGDAMNVIDFSVRKDPSWGLQATLKFDRGKERLDSVLNKNTRSVSSFKLPGTDRTVNLPKPTVNIIPISSKNIQLVNPPNCTNQSAFAMANEETPKYDKSNKWQRVVSIFKQIILNDLEGKTVSFTDKSNVLARKVEDFKPAKILPLDNVATPIKLAAQPTAKKSAIQPTPRSATLPTAKYSPTIAKKGKMVSKSKKKLLKSKKKLLPDSVRGNRVVKNSPKKIVNYFSQREQMSSSYEKVTEPNFSVNSYEQRTGSMRGLR